jgi:hypothetical protein
MTLMGQANYSGEIALPLNHPFDLSDINVPGAGFGLDIPLFWTTTSLLRRDPDDNFVFVYVMITGDIVTGGLDQSWAWCVRGPSSSEF